MRELGGFAKGIKLTILKSKINEPKHFGNVLNSLFQKSNFSDKLNEEVLTNLRLSHLYLVRLTQQLNKSFRGLYMAFYIVNIYFMYSHFLAMLFPPISSYAYLAYQVRVIY